MLVATLFIYTVIYIFPERNGGSLFARCRSHGVGQIYMHSLSIIIKPREGKLPSDDKRKKRELYSNLRILHSLYLMCMAKPKTITGTPAFDKSDDLN